MRRLVALEWACSRPLGKQRGEVEPFLRVCCSSTSNSFLELKLQGSRRGRGKTEVFLAVNMWKSEGCDPPKNRNW